MAKIDRLIEQAQEHIKDERMHVVIMGVYETTIFGGGESVRSGIFMALRNRLVFFAKKLMGFDLESFPYSNISSIEMSKGFSGYAITFFSSGNKVSMKWIAEHQQNDPKDIQGFVDFVKGKMGKKNNPEQGKEDLTEQIKKIADLNKQGILTDEEFQAKKQELLARL